MKLETSDKIFADNLVRIRKERHVSVEQLARDSGVGASSIRNYEKCRTAPPIPYVRKLAKALRVDFNELLGEYPSNREISNKLRVIIADLRKCQKGE